ncbi:VirB3 family type IV secretion system protein [Francisella sp. TX07-6608]|uniref:VirB3 family type IV secretion system protein n=1 Tax=Francisella sp. TX07-6608 TaxID=573568 RepID=UPI0008F98676|nr:VirB3 family type IV secretion system protein [Francisella sp. TX07-6608]OIN82940.1 type IV secretory pathway, VirB3-like family protein [Francisella sp. TX07-6608]
MSNYWHVKQSLCTPILVAGTEKALVVLNLMLCLVFVFGARFQLIALIAIPVGLIIHGICMSISAKDPYMMRVFKRATRYKGYYPAIPINRTSSQGLIKFSCLPKSINGVL